MPPMHVTLKAGVTISPLNISISISMRRNLMLILTDYVAAAYVYAYACIASQVRTGLKFQS